TRPVIARPTAFCWALRFFSFGIRAGFPFTPVVQGFGRGGPGCTGGVYPRPSDFMTAWPASPILLVSCGMGFSFSGKGEKVSDAFLAMAKVPQRMPLPTTMRLLPAVCLTNGKKNRESRSEDRGSRGEDQELTGLRSEA